MTRTMDSLSGSARRRHMKMLRRMRARWAHHYYGVYVRRPHEFRMIERLHRAGLVLAVVSKYGWLQGHTYRELLVVDTRKKAEAHGGPILVGGCL